MIKKIYNWLPVSLSIEIRYIIEILLWKIGIHNSPGHSIKQKIIHNLQKKYNINIFIETGTYMGDMIKAQLKNFNEIYSIELSEYYQKKAIEKFKSHNNVNIILGDSSTELEKLLNIIKEQSIIFLDGHFSGGKTEKGKLECPLIEEINSLKKHNIKNHIIIIDDIRLCGVGKDYPTINELIENLKKINNNYNIKIINDQMITYI